MTNKLILVSTSKPIMSVSKENDRLKIEYKTIDRMYQTPKKEWFFLTEKIQGFATKSDFKALYENKLPIYQFMTQLSDKSRQLFINNKEFKSELCDNFEAHKSRLPDKSLFLNDMPNESILTKADLDNMLK